MLFKEYKEFEEKMDNLVRKGTIDEMHSLQKEYEKSLGFQKGDKCIDYAGRTCWFSRIKFDNYHSLHGVCMVYFDNGYGIPSKRESYGFELKKVEIPSVDKVEVPSVDKVEVPSVDKVKVEDYEFFAAGIITFLACIIAGIVLMVMNW